MLAEGKIPQTLLQGVEAFNHQQFYVCHDLLEAIWMEAIEVDKNFYQGILQIAVGCYHLDNGNWRGAVILLGEGIRRLAFYQPSHYGIDVSQLRQESYTLLQFLQNLGEEQFVADCQQNEGRLPTAIPSCPLPKIVSLNA
jgi:predicted metal-dependent hydrolase